MELEINEYTVKIADDNRGNECVWLEAHGTWYWTAMRNDHPELKEGMKVKVTIELIEPKKETKTCEYYYTGSYTPCVQEPVNDSKFCKKHIEEKPKTEFTFISFNELLAGKEPERLTGDEVHDVTNRIRRNER